jgi:hypothetical protein
LSPPESPEMSRVGTLVNPTPQKTFGAHKVANYPTPPSTIENPSHKSSVSSTASDQSPTPRDSGLLHNPRFFASPLPMSTVHRAHSTSSWSPIPPHLTHTMSAPEQIPVVGQETIPRLIPQVGPLPDLYSQPPMVTSAFTSPGTGMQASGVPGHNNYPNTSATALLSPTFPVQRLSQPTLPYAAGRLRYVPPGGNPGQRRVSPYDGPLPSTAHSKPTYDPRFEPQRPRSATPTGAGFYPSGQPPFSSSNVSSMSGNQASSPLDPYPPRPAQRPLFHSPSSPDPVDGDIDDLGMAEALRDFAPRGEGYCKFVKGDIIQILEESGKDCYIGVNTSTGVEGLVSQARTAYPTHYLISITT